MNIQFKSFLLLVGRIYEDGIGFAIVPKGNVKPFIFKIKTAK